MIKLIKFIHNRIDLRKMRYKKQLRIYLLLLIIISNISKIFQMLNETHLLSSISCDLCNQGHLEKRKYFNKCNTIIFEIFVTIIKLSINVVQVVHWHLKLKKNVESVISSNNYIDICFLKIIESIQNNICWRFWLMYFLKHIDREQIQIHFIRYKLSLIIIIN